jgi:hypothetical protein
MARSQNVLAVRMVRKLLVDAAKAKVGRQVWDLLTALRGPDIEVDNVKKRTTCRIRGALITPRLFQDAYRHRISPPIYTGNNRRKVSIDILDAQKVSSHFREHIEKAVAVLNGK